MRLFGSKPDTLSLTMKRVEGYRDDDSAVIAEARDLLARVPTMDILYALFRFGQSLAPALRAKYQDIVGEVVFRHGR